MKWYEIMLTIINILAVLIGPLVAVIITQRLQQKKDKRQDKIEVFRHLMTYRHLGYYDSNSVNIINSIPIVFWDNDEVIQAYYQYLDLLNSDKTNLQEKLKQIDFRKNDMLETMAKSLGYDNINWCIIRKSYLPKELINENKMENTDKKNKCEN